MYAKKDIIYSSTMGLVVVKDVTKLSPDKSAPVLYYVLRSYYDKEKVAYIPVENHEVELRDVISMDEAEGLKPTIAKRIINNEIDINDFVLGEVAYVLSVSPAELIKCLTDNTDSEEEN